MLVPQVLGLLLEGGQLVLWDRQPVHQPQTTSMRQYEGGFLGVYVQDQALLSTPAQPLMKLKAAHSASCAGMQGVSNFTEALTVASAALC